MTDYEELMARRTALHEEWMRRVTRAKEDHGGAMTFWSPGIVVNGRGELSITAFAPNSWHKLWELSSQPGRRAVTFTVAA